MTFAWISLTLFACLVCTVEGRVCTRVRGQTGVKTVKYPAECHQSYEARCGWFSSQMCTFNETVPCIKEHNISATIYQVVEDCCPGYHKNKDGKCASKGSNPGSPEERKPEDDDLQPVFIESHTADSGDDDDDKVTSEAGIGHSRNGGGDDDDDDDNKFFLGISHGAYAGIICGILFVACVWLF